MHQYLYTFLLENDKNPSQAQNPQLKDRGFSWNLQLIEGFLACKKFHTEQGFESRPKKFLEKFFIIKATV
jgi:hypothetical protein